MSLVNQANVSNSNFTKILQAASNEYRNLTKNDLHAHPFAAALDSCDSPDAVLNLFRRQAEAFNEFCKGDDRLMKWLNPTVHIVFTFSATLGTSIGLPFPPAKAIFTGIGVLLGVAKDVIASHGTLVNLFERIQFFLQRLNIYDGISLTTEMMELLGKIMTQLLTILALSTKEMTRKRIKKFLNMLVGRTEVQDALQRLDMLTKEEAGMMVARNLAVSHVVDGNVKVVADTMKVIKDGIDDQKQNQSREKLRTWLAPPDPCINHNIACDLQHGATATWFIQGSTLNEWKTNGSLLWIRGNPGSGKSILCSAIIEDVKRMQKYRSALMVYYYFDFKDATKRDLRGLLCSLLTQICKGSDHCWGCLSQLYTTCGDGSEQPSETALANCLRNMLELAGQDPVYIILDALDECPNTTGTPSPREKVLTFLNDLLVSKHPNLYICVTSRPEQDIQSILDPLAHGSRSISLHEEGGQREDIVNYVHFFVYNDTEMRRWIAEDKELVICTLSERAQGMFRWVFCQLDTLRRCMPSSIRKALNELPITLDETYARTLQCIPEEKRQYAHRLFQCLVAAVRPLRVEELAEIFAIQFDLKAIPDLVEDWRPLDPEKDVLSTCSSLIAIVDVEGSKVVQFSHFSVKEFLTSARLANSDVGNISHYHIPLEPAHTILARACLAVLLKLNDKTDKTRLATFPLGFYAAQHWVDHAKFENAASQIQIQDAMKCLFDPKKSHLAAWTWIHDVDMLIERSVDELEEYPPPPQATPLYYAAFCGFSGLVNHLITVHTEDVNAQCGHECSVLYAAVRGGHIDIIRVLLDHKADINTGYNHGQSLLHLAYEEGHVEAMRLLLDHGADVDVREDNCYETVLHLASEHGHVEAVQLLLQHNADVNARNFVNWTPLHNSSWLGHIKAAQLLVEYGADLNAQNEFDYTPLIIAALYGWPEIVRLLLGHGADVHIRGEDQTAFYWATVLGHHEVAQLLLEHGAEGE